MIKIKLLLCYLGLVVSLTACGDKSGDKNRATVGSEKVGNPRVTQNKQQTVVEIAQPQINTASSYYLTTTTLSPGSDADINARTSGVIKKIFKEEGDDVVAGEVLLKLEDDHQQLKLKQAQQKLDSAKREFQRINTMKKSKLASDNDWETAQNAMNLAETDYELADLTLSYTQITAPFAGRIVWRNIDLGDDVKQGDLLFRMMSLHPLLAKVYIPANRIGSIGVADQVELKIDGEHEQNEQPKSSQRLQGAISLISPIVDPTTGTIKLTIQLASYPEGVRPGDFVEVKVITDHRENALMIPTVAVIEDRNQKYVYVVEDDFAQKQVVTTGFVDEINSEILSGLTLDSQIVVKGQRNLNQGMRVRVVNSSESSMSSISSGSGTENLDGISVDNLTKKESKTAKHSPRAKNP